MYQDADQLENVFLSWLRLVAEIFDVVEANVDLVREREMVIDLGSPHVYQVEVESFEVKDEVIWHILEAGPSRD
jgi:hypothetical protein